MKTWKTTLLAAAATFGLASAAAAQESPMTEPAEAAASEDAAEVDDSGVDFSFNVGVATDYVFRGISQTDENVQVFGGVDVALPNNVYAGVWASNIDYSAFGDSDTNVELDLYAGVKPEVGGFVLDFAAIYYAYFNQPETSAELGYFEAKAAASRAFGPGTLGAAVYYSPEFSGEIGRATYVEANGAYTINDRVSLSGAIGYQDFEIDADYATANVGATVVLTPNLGLDLRYHTTDADDFGDAYDDRFAAVLKATF